VNSERTKNIPINVTVEERDILAKLSIEEGAASLGDFLRKCYMENLRLTHPKIYDELQCLDKAYQIEKRERRAEVEAEKKAKRLMKSPLSAGSGIGQSGSEPNRRADEGSKQAVSALLENKGQNPKAET
jgi:hypothetical protein